MITCVFCGEPVLEGEYICLKVRHSGESVAVDDEYFHWECFWKAKQLTEKRKILPL
jgi:hypothetical protein